MASNTWLCAPRAYALSSVICKWFKSQLCCSCSNYPYSGWFCGLIDYHQGICYFSATEDVEGKNLNKCVSLTWQLPKCTYMHVRILFLQRGKVKTWGSLKLKTLNSTDFFIYLNVVSGSTNWQRHPWCVKDAWRGDFSVWAAVVKWHLPNAALNLTVISGQW